LGMAGDEWRGAGRWDAGVPVGRAPAAEGCVGGGVSESNERAGGVRYTADLVAGDCGESLGGAHRVRGRGMAFEPGAAAGVGRKGRACASAELSSDGLIPMMGSG